MPVYSVKLAGKETLIAADNKSQAIAATIHPLLEEVSTLSPNQIAEKVNAGLELKLAKVVLATEQGSAVGEDGRSEDEPPEGKGE